MAPEEGDQECGYFFSVPGGLLTPWRAYQSNADAGLTPSTLGAAENLRISLAPKSPLQLLHIWEPGRKRPSCFLEETGEGSRQQMADCRALRSKDRSSQVQGHGWGCAHPAARGRWRNSVSRSQRSSSSDLSRGPGGLPRGHWCPDPLRNTQQHLYAYKQRTLSLI